MYTEKEEETLLTKRDQVEIDGFVEPFAVESIALTVASFVFSLGVNIYQVPLKFYLYDVADISASDYTILNAIESLPRSLLPIFGILPLLLTRRKTKNRHKYWWCFGVSIASSAYLYLGLASSTSYGTVMFWLTFASVGASLASTMQSMMLVERTRREEKHKRGRFALYSAASAYCGALTGQLFASTFYKNELHVFNTWSGLSIKAIFLIVALVPACLVFPLVPYLQDSIAEDQHVKPPPTILHNYKTALSLVTEPKVILCTLFGAVLSVLLINNASQTDFFLKGCGLTEPEYCWLEISMSSASWLVVVIYRRFFFAADFRSTIFSIYCLRAALKINSALGISLGFADSALPCLFWIGTDTVLMTCVDVIANELLTVLVLIAVANAHQSTATLSPSDTTKEDQHLYNHTSESLAFLTISALFNVCSSLSDILDVDLQIHIWHVGTFHLENQRYDGYIKLELLTAILPLATIAFLPLLPRNRASFSSEEDLFIIQAKEANNRKRRCMILTAFISLWFGGIVFVFWDSVQRS